MSKLANAGDWMVQAKLKMLFLLIKEDNKGRNTQRKMINYDYGMSKSKSVTLQ